MNRVILCGRVVREPEIRYSQTANGSMAVEVIGSIDDTANDNVINEGMQATVQPGGSFWQIANDYLGDGNRAAELAEYNNMTLESGLYAGMVLRLPD